MIEEERALLECPWKEAFDQTRGKKYYYHERTRATKWEMPEEYKVLYDIAQKALETRRIAAAEANKIQIRKSQQRSNEMYLKKSVPEIQFEGYTYEERKKAFCDLLEENNIRPGMTWDETMRKIITSPAYRALESLRERKETFEAYMESEAKREREEKKEREEKQQRAFTHLLGKTKEIKHFSRFSTARRIFQNAKEFTQLESYQQREYFEKYISELKHTEMERQSNMRKESLERFDALLRSLPEITFKTGWKEAKSLYRKTSLFQSPDAFQGMNKLDFLTAFENYNDSLWKEPDEQLLNKRHARERRERRARDDFKVLLKELREQKLLHARTKWKDIYSTLREDQRYLGMLGLSGSTPLDLFFDLKDELQAKMHDQKYDVQDTLKRYDFEVRGDTTFDAYRQILEKDERLADRVSEENIKLIFEHLQEKAQYHEKRKREKELYKKIDALRYAMKALDPPVNVSDTWESVRPRVEELQEFKDLEDESSRISAFEKLVRRLKEKQGGHADEEEEEGMLKEEDEYSSRSHRSRSRGSPRRRSRHSSSRHSNRRDSDKESDLDNVNYSRKKRKRSESRSDVHERVAVSRTEDGDALDEYEKFSRRVQH